MRNDSISCTKCRYYRLRVLLRRHVYNRDKISTSLTPTQNVNKGFSMVLCVPCHWYHLISSSSLLSYCILITPKTCTTEHLLDIQSTLTVEVNNQPQRFRVSPLYSTVFNLDYLPSRSGSWSCELSQEGPYKVVENHRHSLPFEVTHRWNPSFPR